MSVRVVFGAKPSGKPHPVAKWGLLMALLVMVMLGVPAMVSAGPPSVQSPTGAMSGGVFTGTYTFVTYISCSSGLNYNSSYSNSLEGTHTFGFYGAPDGSLLVSIDGGGMLLVNSCGDPYATPHTNVANYTVTKDSTPPSPTPSPTPTPTPTPTSAPSGGGTSGGSQSGGSGAAGPAVRKSPGVSASSSPTPSAAPGQTLPPAAGSGAEVRPSASPTPYPLIRHGQPQPAAANPAGASRALVLPWTAVGLPAAAALALALLLWRSPRLRDGLGGGLRSAITPLRLRLEPLWFRLRRAVAGAVAARLRVTGHDLPRRRGLSAHHHTGKVLAHHHTSYPALAFLVLLSTVLAAAATYSSQAASSVVSLTVSGPPPSTPATIDDPLDQDRFSVGSQTIRGTCPSGLLVEIYRNGDFAGSGMCDVNGLYAVLITLVPGQNDLVARDVDGLGQYGPDSNTISVFYDPPPTPSPSPTPSPTATPSAAPAPASPTPKPSGGATTPKPKASPAIPPLLVVTDQHSYQGAETGAPVSITATIKGGRPPYRVSWQWGDGAVDRANPSSSTSATQEHTYDKPGPYQVIVRATDSQGRESLMQVVVIVNGPISATGAGSISDRIPGNLVVAWPLIGATTLAVLSFWLGERHRLASLRPTSGALHY